MGRFLSAAGAGTGALLLTSLYASFASAVEYVSVQGSNFISNSTGNRFDIIGVDYQPGGSSGFNSTWDPLSDPEACLRDAIIMQKLGVNTIRVYNLNGDIDHNQCVSIFNAAGIYMILDVNSGLANEYIDRSDPSSTYTIEYLEHIFSIVEAFAQFPNTLGFFAANEIINQQSSYDAPLYIRAVVRDLREYISLHAPRQIPVGYSAADVDTMLKDTWNYLGCELENSTLSRIEFFGLNDYEWCGDSSYTKSGYNDLVTMFSDTNIPVFFSEYGCNLVQPRTFTNVPVLYGDQMSLLSGGLVYEYSQETDDYGLVVINSTTEITLRTDYNSLYQEFIKLDEATLTKVNSTAESQTASTCAADLISNSTFENSWDLPARPSGGDSLVTKGVSSASTGSLVSVTATTMPATVYNYTGAEVTGLSLVELGCSDYNYPGLIATYTSKDESCSYVTGTKASSSSSSDDSDSASTTVGVDRFAVSVVAAIVFSFFGGALLL